MDFLALAKDVGGFAVNRSLESLSSSAKPTTEAPAPDPLGAEARQANGTGDKVNPGARSPVDDYFGSSKNVGASKGVRDYSGTGPVSPWLRWAMISGAVLLVLLGGRKLLKRRK